MLDINNVIYCYIILLNTNTNTKICIHLTASRMFVPTATKSAEVL